jgi:hypothetical protein
MESGSLGGRCTESHTPGDLAAAIGQPSRFCAFLGLGPQKTGASGGVWVR